MEPSLEVRVPPRGPMEPCITTFELTLFERNGKKLLFEDEPQLVIEIDNNTIKRATDLKLRNSG
jgi:hypothetical protein